MDDRTLLERAARAAGLHTTQWAEPGDLLPDKGGWVQYIGHGRCVIFNSLNDDGDAMRLAVKLKMDLVIGGGKTTVYCGGHRTNDYHGDDPYAATRRAITRAAAALADAGLVKEGKKQ